MKKSIIAALAIGSVGTLAYRAFNYGMAGLVPPMPGDKRRHRENLLLVIRQGAKGGSRGDAGADHG